MSKHRKRLKQPTKNQSTRLVSPAHPAIESTQHRKPMFALTNLQKGYCLSDCELSEKAEFAETIWRLSQLTWSEIQRSGKHQSGCETIPQSAIRVGLPPCVTPEVKLLAFRFADKKAMVGYRKGELFHVLWLDRAFTLYHHG